MDKKDLKQNTPAGQVDGNGENHKNQAETQKPVKKKTKIKSWVFLLILDIIMLGIAVFFVVNLPKKAVQLKNARNDEQKVKESKNVDVTGLEHQPTKESVDELLSYYPKEEGVIEFIKNMEKLQTEEIVKNFSLVSDGAVKDKTGSYGIPFITEFEGTWENVGSSLKTFQNLPHLIRAINIEVKVVNENVINFKYGGFLYVSDKLAKVR